MYSAPPQDKLHKHLHISNACEHSWIMMIMVGSEMSKAEYDHKAIMYPAYDTPYKLCNIKGNWNIQQPTLPLNNAGRPIIYNKIIFIDSNRNKHAITPSSWFRHHTAKLGRVIRGLDSICQGRVLTMK